MSPKPYTLVTVAEFAQKIGPHIADEFGNGSGGGFLCICDRFGRPKLLIQIAEPVLEKSNKYSELALEKAVRLYNHPDHDLSQQSQNPDKDQYQGAIKLVLPLRGFISFSGFPAAVDEAFCMCLAYECGLIKIGALEALSSISGNNELVAKMLEFIGEIVYE